MGEGERRLAVVATHPVQYHAPLFRALAATAGLALKVYYLWDPGAAARADPEFGQVVRWDVPLLDGYDSEFVPNVSRAPGTARFFGLRNPALASRVEAFAPHAVLLFGYRFASLLGYVFGRRRRAVPLLFRGDSHRLARRSGDALRRPLIAAVYRRFGGFLAVGAANRAYFLAHGVPEHRLFHAPHAVDNARFAGAAESARGEAREWRAALGIPPGDAVALFAGKLIEKKRPGDLLAAFLRAGLDDVTLLMVGSGPEEAHLRALAGAHPRVRFAPFQNQSLMPRTYAAGNLLVLPSAGPYETWGLAVNEAMCLSRAAIVSSHVGCGPDLVVPGETGWVFEAGDVDALAECLREAFADRARLARMGENAARRVARYSYDAVVRGTLEALDAVASRGHESHGLARP